MPLFIAAGIAAAGAIGGAAISSSASNKAVDATQASSAAAIAEQRRQFDIAQQNQQPWLQTGAGALSKLATLYGIAPPAGAAPAPGNGNGSAPYYTGPVDTGVYSAAPIPEAPQGGTYGYNTNNAELLRILGGSLSPGKGNPLIGGVGLAALTRGNSTPIQDIARAMSQGIAIKPSDWAKAGLPPDGGAVGQQLKTAIFGPQAPQGQPQATQQPQPVAQTQSPVDPTAPPEVQTQQQTQAASGQPQYADFYQSPDYTFALEQGVRGVDAGAAARGYLDSGATRKAEINYAGNIASSAYNNYAGRLQALAGVGQSAATNLGNLGSSYATNVGNIVTNQGNNRASSYLANGQTYGNTIGQLAGGFSGLVQNGAFGNSNLPPGAMSVTPQVFGSNVGGYAGGFA